MLKKTLGISRNKHDAYLQAKISIFKKKNRYFPPLIQDSNTQIKTKIPSHKVHWLLTQDQINPNPDQLLCETTRNSSSSEKSYEYHTTCVQLCQEVKDLLQKVTQISIKFINKQRKTNGFVSKISLQFFQRKRDSKKRSEHLQLKQISCQSIRQIIKKNILKAQKSLTQIRNMKGKTLMQQKYYRNMEMSLAQQIREASRDLRNQQKEYFQLLKTYEKGTINIAIQLNAEDRERMKSADNFDLFMTEQQMNEQDERNLGIQEIVKSINQLTTVYRDLNELVIHQGSLIDRIDFNIEETFTHIQKGNEYLRSADEWASNKYARKCIVCLMSAILILAVVLGFKYSGK